MPKNYVLSKRAVNDISEIWNYTYDTWSEKQADKYYDEILKECKRLTKYPSAGKDYSRLLKGLRGAIINKHIIFFLLIHDKKIEIVRILHSRMDLKLHFKK